MTTSARRRPPRLEAALPWTERLVVKVVSLMVLGGLALALWQSALPRVFGLDPFAAADGEVVRVVVTRCEGAGALGHTCEVRLPPGDGSARTVTLTDPGLFAPQPGDHLDVRPRGDGYALAGWRAAGEAGLLLSLAVAFTGFAVGAFRRVLEHGDERR